MRTMKSTYPLLFVVAVLLSLAGCKETIEGELGTPFDKVAGMSGDWELHAFTQTDLNNPVQEQRDLTFLYTEGVTQPLTLSFDAEGTYAVALEQGKNYFGEGGTWTFDDLNYPTFLLLDTGTDTLEFNLGAVVRPFDQDMSIEIQKGCDGTETVIYSFDFTRKSE